jgi:hypothetical protein
MVTTDPRKANRFLTELYGADAPGYLAVFVGDKQNTTHWFSADDLESAAKRSTGLAARSNVFFGVGLQPEIPNTGGRGKADNVCAIPGVWVDVDVAGLAHKETQLPATTDEARAWIARFPLGPTIVNHSGHGLQAWWLFKEPLTIETDDERYRARDLVQRFQAAIRRSGNGWKLDATADLARLLRLPGTINHKNDPKLVNVAEYDLSNRYDPEELERYLPTEGELSFTQTTDAANDDDFMLANLDMIAAECAWMRHCRDDAATLNEPNWYASLSIIGRCENGDELAHDWSDPHPGYTAEETTEKLAQARERSGPRTCKHVRDVLGAEDYCGGCKHWQKIKSPIQLGRLNATLNMPTEDNVEQSASPKKAAMLEHFRAYMPEHRFIYMPTGELWPAASVNKGLKKIPTGRVNDKGKEIFEPASDWIVRNRPVQQMTWAPGEPSLIHDRLISDGGWFSHPGATVFNLYRPSIVKPGDATKALHWLNHVRKVYPDDAVHIIHWLAHRVQYPGDKINHALVLGGAQGVGKDTLLEPVKYAIGPWNFQEVSPSHMMGRFNGFVKSVILRVSEARDLGDVNRYAFYDHMKIYTAAPPDVLRVDEKNRHEYSVFNVCGVVLTSNEKTSGIYLPPDDRRHYVAWSDLTALDFTPEYWNFLYRWFGEGGHQHVTAYLAELDLSAFNPKAPPRKTAAFWDIVDANRAPEDAELADVLDKLQNPPAVTLTQIIHYADFDLKDWLRDRKNSRTIPHRLAAVGYARVRNDGAKDGQWVVDGKRQAIYVREELSPRDRIVAANKVVGTNYLKEVA